MKKKKIISTLVAVALIIIIAAVAFGGDFIESLTYSSKRVELDDYFHVAGDELAIVLQDELLEEKALLHEERCYFDSEVVLKYFSDSFYIDETEGKLLYSTPAEVYGVEIGGTKVSRIFTASGPGGEQDSMEELGYTAAMEQGDKLYIAADYLERFLDCSVELFDWHVQVYTQWEDRYTDSVLKDTAVREEGDPQSPILCDLAAEDGVEVLRQGEEWTYVKTRDSILGYVENKRLNLISQGLECAYEEAPKSDYAAPEYTSLAMDGKVVLGFHSIGSGAGNDTLDEMAAGAEGMNVIAPTWFSLKDEEGGFRSYSDSAYVEKAHGMGLKVWGVWDDFNANLENNADADVLAALKATSVRQSLAQSMVQTSLDLKLDGINIDFENVTEENGADFVQFLRELSILCRGNGLFLSVDNYVPYDYRSFYGIDVQGVVADYVIIMGYDEHWHGSGDPGSVASIGYVRDGIARTLEKVPAKKVVNALPLYTLVWKTGSEVSDEALSIRNTEAYLESRGVTPQWDDVTCQNYASWTQGEETYQVWLEDAQSIEVKLNVMSVQQIGGVAAWRLGYGTPQIWELIRAYASQ